MFVLFVFLEAEKVIALIGMILLDRISSETHWRSGDACEVIIGKLFLLLTNYCLKNRSFYRTQSLVAHNWSDIGRLFICPRFILAILSGLRWLPCGNHSAGNVFKRPLSLTSFAFNLWTWLYFRESFLWTSLNRHLSERLFVYSTEIVLISRSFTLNVFKRSTTLWNVENACCKLQLFSTWSELCCSCSNFLASYCLYFRAFRFLQNIDQRNDNPNFGIISRPSHA
jgi:hypothetical protein